MALIVAVMLFSRLSSKAQEVAITNYKNGWEETHPVDDLTRDEIRNILNDNDEYLYLSDGTDFNEDEEE